MKNEEKSIIIKTVLDHRCVVLCQTLKSMSLGLISAVIRKKAEKLSCVLLGLCHTCSIYLKGVITAQCLQSVHSSAGYMRALLEHKNV